MDANPLPPLPCDTILFRALIYDNLISKDGSHKLQTFIRRREADPHGLSLVDTIQHCKEGMQRGIFGVRSVHVGTLRDNGFDVIPDTTHHGNLRLIDGQNLPRRQDDELEANRLAEVLMNCSRPVAYFNDDDADDRFQAEIEAKRNPGQ